MKFSNKIIPIIILVFLALQCSIISHEDKNKSEIVEPIIESISASQSYEMIQDNLTNENFVILDIRTPDEYQSGHIENAHNIDFYFSTFEDDLDKLDKTLTYLIYCRSGGRSGQALEKMENLNFEIVYNMLGGMIKWKSLDYPVTI